MTRSVDSGDAPRGEGVGRPPFASSPDRTRASSSMVGGDPAGASPAIHMAAVSGRDWPRGPPTRVSRPLRGGGPARSRTDGDVRVYCVRQWLGANSPAYCVRPRSGDTITWQAPSGPEVHDVPVTNGKMMMSFLPDDGIGFMSRTDASKRPRHPGGARLVPRARCELPCPRVPPRTLGPVRGPCPIASPSSCADIRCVNPHIVPTMCG